MAEHRALGEAPIVLAIESATARASVALLAGERVLGERRSEVGRHHSETLLPMIDAALKEAGVIFDELDGLAISIGPGAFTSLRIGLSTVKGLCFGSDLPVVAISTLAALACAAWGRGRVGDGAIVAPLLDAHRGEVYAAAYRRDGPVVAAPTELVSPCVLDPEEITVRLPEGAWLVGDGIAVVREEVDRLAPGRFEWVAGPGIEPDAVAVGRLALAELRAGRGSDAASLVPRYVRRAEAEVTRTRQRFE